MYTNLNYIWLMNRFWRMNKIYEFTASEAYLYFKLLDFCNKLCWKNGFEQSNRYISGETGICVRTLIKARERLCEAGLIWFESGRTERCQSRYFLLTGDPEEDAAITGADEAAGEDFAGQSEAGIDTQLPENQSNSEESVTVESGAETVVESGQKAGEKAEDDCQNNSRQNAPSSGQQIALFDEHIANKLQTNCKQNGAKSTHYNKHKTNKPKTKKGKRKGKKKNFCEEGEPSSLSPLEAKQVDEIFNYYQKVCTNLPKVDVRTVIRISHIKTRIKEHGIEKVKQMLNIASQSDFLAGRNNRGWTATIDFLMLPTNFIKVIEGHYNTKPPDDLRDPYTKPSPIQMLKDAYQKILETDPEYQT